MGFPNSMVSLIMTCIRTVSFSILINGQPTDKFQPQRGIRQGDPLSPYIFIICAEVLSGLISESQEKGLIHGISMATNAPNITHLLYADDSLLFCKASPKEALVIHNILKKYQHMSGLKVNMDKSEMVFSPNIDHITRTSFQANLPVKISNSISKLNTTLYMMFLKLLLALILVMLGEVSLKLFGLSIKVVFGKLVMGKRLEFLRIIGFPFKMVSKFYLQETFPITNLGSMIFFKTTLLTGITLSYMLFSLL